MAFAGYLKQSTVADILIGPFVDDTDGKTAETGLTLDVEVSKNGQALANKSDVTTPVHDAAGDVDGYYNCELDATDTATLGILTVVAHASGALPVRLDYQVVVAHWWDAMCTSTDGVVLATGAVDADAVATAGANKIADHTIRRTFQNACDSGDGDTKAGRSLLGAIAKLVNKVASATGTVTIYEDDDTTSLFTQAVTTDAGAEPITVLDTD